MAKRMAYNSRQSVGMRSRDTKTSLTPAPTTGRPRASRRPSKGDVKPGPHSKA